MTLRNVSRALARVCEILAAAILLVVCLINFTQVGGRYLIGTSLSWGEETMRYIMMWLMMLGSVTAVYRAEHMAVEGLQDLVAPKHRQLVRSALYGIGGVFFVLLAYYGWASAIRNLAQHAAASGMPMIIPYMAIPVGSVLIIIQIMLCWVSGFEAENHE
ncbi:TRAP transporter small permease [Rhizobiaceae bacterium n13]|uniref:TRAP transporter small permease protein n=1 Tax=Ferirhizobium litorale TaxID=2927786 RepID=A0AAE3QH99_9HYPH|nr:TRAP transporter small permease [Fererhizobium litorale]MDI7862644.1 TRAP transporter small permease [Fererhizobium litorale]MDI7923873.1 TRAP transporter small permease [Fererhizobium litorale]